MTQTRLENLREKLVERLGEFNGGDHVYEWALVLCDDYELCEKTQRGPDGALCATDCAVALKLEQQFDQLADALGIAPDRDEKGATR